MGDAAGIMTHATKRFVRLSVIGDTCLEKTKSTTTEDSGVMDSWVLYVKDSCLSLFIFLLSAFQQPLSIPTQQDQQQGIKSHDESVDDTPPYVPSRGVSHPCGGGPTSRCLVHHHRPRGRLCSWEQ